MKFAKKSENKNKIAKNEGYFFGQHPLVEKSPTATDIFLAHNIGYYDSDVPAKFSSDTKC